MIKLPQTIKMVITDFDGIVTDNCIYVDEEGKMSRKLNFKDVMAFSILRKNNYMIGIISGEKNAAIDILKEKFQIEEVHQGIRKKLDVLDNIIKKYALTDEEFVYIGDDVNDYDSLCRAKYAVTVPTAVKKILDIEGIQVTENPSGSGAFREVVDALIS